MSEHGNVDAVNYEGSALAVHSTHEAAEKIAGIGAVLEGVHSQKQYQQSFPRSLLVGAYHFPDAPLPLLNVYFDSASPGPIVEKWGYALKGVADRFGTRIVYGRRRCGSVPVDVLLSSPDGIMRGEVDSFSAFVNGQFGFDLPGYENLYPAIEYLPDEFLDRMLRQYDLLARDPNAPEAAWPLAERALYDSLGRPLYGGAVSKVDSSGQVRVSFPRLSALDNFAALDRANHYLIELQFYFFAALPLWEATRALIDIEYKPRKITLFAHDWMGVPLFWAMRREPTYRRVSTVYFAHETRICRLLVEGVLKDRVGQLKRRCHPDGHDVSFYAYLSRLEKDNPLATVGGAFAGQIEAFDSLFYHKINSQAAHFDHIAAVGRNVARETSLILRGANHQPPISVCPNGIPNYLGINATTTNSSDHVVNLQQQARQRLLDLAQGNIGFKPDYIFSSVNRCEISKAPWRNVAFFGAFMNSAPQKNRSALFIWLSRPKPLPSLDEISRWAEYGWPTKHKAREDGGDLRPEELPLWNLIDALNTAGNGRYHVMYINQFGWEGKLGSLNLAGSQFLDVRNGTDVELGLSVYEPFGIAPLEPFGSGAICVLSDSCGCAAHLTDLKNKGLVSDDSFVIGAFTDRDVEPARVDLRTLREIESEVYANMIDELTVKLQTDRRERIHSAQRAMPHLSWEAAVRQLPNAILPTAGNHQEPSTERASS